jgi:hypothetical protein
MSEVEQGSDQINAEIMEKEGVDESVVTMSVEAEDAENAAEEDRLARVAASDTDIPELGDPYPDPDETPTDEVKPEYDPLPGEPPDLPVL